MNAPFSTLDPELATRFVLTLAHFLWQGAAIGVAVLLLGLILRGASARVRYALFVVALLAMALCPPVTYWAIDSTGQPGEESLALSWLNPEQSNEAVDTESLEVPATPLDADQSEGLPLAAADQTGSNEHQAPPSPATDELNGPHPAATLQLAKDWHTYTPYLILAYVIGVMAMLLRLALGLAGGGRLRRRAEPITEHVVLEAVRRHAAALKLRATPVVASCRRVAVPTVVGLVRPMILLPASLATGMPPQQVELLLLHELAHIRRYDHVLNILQRLIEAALFFHPAVWYVSHRIRVEREHCCDDLVIALGGEPRVYAESLVTAAALASGTVLSPAALAATGKPSQLRHRIHRLLGDPTPPVRLVRGGWVLVALVAVALIAGATQLSGINSPLRENDAVTGADASSAVLPEQPSPHEEYGTVHPLAASEAAGSRAVEATPDSSATQPAAEDQSASRTRPLAGNEPYELLDDPDWWLRKVTVQQIGDIKGEREVYILIDKLKDQDPRVQAAAAEGLAKQGDPKAIKHLVAALKDKTEVREAAAEALTHFKPDEVMPLLTLAARDEDDSVRRGAIDGLARQDTPEAAAVLVELLPKCYVESGKSRSPRALVRPGGGPSNLQPPSPMGPGPTGYALAEAFGKMRAEVVRPVLEQSCASEDWKTRMVTTLIIGQSNLRSDESIQRLLTTLLGDDQKDVRAAAAQVLANEIESRVNAGEAPNPEIIASLVPLLHDANRQIAALAAQSLRTAGWQPPTIEDRAWFLVAAGQGQEAASFGSVAFEPLIHALNADLTPAFSRGGHTSPPPFNEIDALAKLDDPRKIDPLIEALPRFDDDMTQFVARALGETGDPKAVDPLIGVLGSLNARVRMSAAEALGKIKDPRAVDPLLSLLNDSDGNVRDITVQALGEIGDPRAAEALRPLLEEKDRPLTPVVRALGQLHDTESASQIAALAMNDNYGQDPRQECLTSLGEIGGPVAFDTCIQILTKETDRGLRQTAASVLGELGDPAAVGALRDCLQFDTDDNVKDAAVTALGEIGGRQGVEALLSSLEDRLEQPRARPAPIEVYVSALARISDPAAADALTAIYKEAMAHNNSQLAFLSAKALADRDDPRAKAMLEELRGEPRTRIDATNALQELERQSAPEGEVEAPDVAGPSAKPPGESGQPDRAGTPDHPHQQGKPTATAPTDRSDQSDPSDQPAAGVPQTSRLPGSRLQFRWVVDGDDAKAVLPTPTEFDSGRKLAVGDEVIFYEGGIADAEVVKEPNSEYYQIRFETRENWVERLREATERNQGKKLAIIFDGRLLCAPVVQAPIGKSGVITGNLTHEEAEAVAKAIMGHGQRDENAPLPEPFLYDSVRALNPEQIQLKVNDPTQEDSEVQVTPKATEQ